MHTTAIGKRRASFQQLVELVSEENIRQRLAEEAAAASGHPRRGLMELWRSVVTTAVVVIDDIVKNKTRLARTDVMMLRKVLQFASTSQEGFESAFAPDKLTRKEVKLVTGMAIELLDLDVAEVEALDILSLICGRDEYVRYFRPRHEIQAIMEQVEKRLLPNESKPDQSTIAAAILEKLITTAAAQRITMAVLMSSVLKMVRTWCEDFFEGESPRMLAEQSPLIAAVTAILRSNPEQAVAPLGRHGGVLLKFVRRRYLTGDNVQRRVLSEYLLAHL